MSQVLRITGRDPLLFGDGRPFGPELGALAARSLPLPSPGALAGFLRTRLGDSQGWDWNGEGPERALAASVAGPLLQMGEEPVFPAPADALVAGSESAPSVERLRPFQPCPGAACDLPRGLLPLRVESSQKPLKGYRYWTARDVFAWLEDGALPVPRKVEGPATEERTHVEVRGATKTASEGHLFTTEGLALGERWAFLACVEDGGRVSDGLTPFGGEARLAEVQAADRSTWPSCPPVLATRLENARAVRMLLATPAIFGGGWQPGWLDGSLCGSPPGAAGVTLRLAAAAVPRRQAVSGWDYRTRAPKPVRWLAPAGSVYFFELVSGDAGPVAESGWLKPVSDELQDRRDGYGLALWGLWERGGAG